MQIWAENVPIFFYGMKDSKSQSILYSLIGYSGSLIGILATLFLFPKDLSFYGKIRYIIPTAELFIPLIVFGLSFSLVKFDTQIKGRRHEFLGASLGIVFFNFLVFLLVSFLLFNLLPGTQNLKLFRMRSYVYPLILIFSFGTLFGKMLSNYGKIAVPNFFDAVLPKLASLLAFCLYFFKICSAEISLWVFVGCIGLGLLGYILYYQKVREKRQGSLDFSFLSDVTFRKVLFQFSLFGFLGNIGNYIAFRIDNVMVGEFLGFSANGIYSIYLSILGLVSLPQMGIHTISAPKINQFFSSGDMVSLQKLHYDTSAYLLVFGILAIGNVILGFPYLCSIIKNGNLVWESRWALYILSIGILIDMATGFNSHIISFSPYFRFTIYIMLGLSVFTIGLNYLFLQYSSMGIVGVAMATTISLVAYNLIKLRFNYKKFKVFPFNHNSVKTISLSFILVVSVQLLDSKTLGLTLAKCIVFSLLFFFLLEKLNLFPIVQEIKKIPIFRKLKK